MAFGEREAQIRAAALARHAPSVAVFAKTLLMSVGADNPALLEAFASMLLNRFLYEREIDGAVGIVGILADAREFSCWRDARAMDGVDFSSPEFRVCLRVARRALEGRLADSVNGAMRFERAVGKIAGAEKPAVGGYVFF
ncbi:MAG: hypothetical protein LBO78_03995 [Rickettsiales bacterium]|jgi:hypothetical protein|nr:hypothetical protein [Rickettsiales bacterium]